MAKAYFSSDYLGFFFFLKKTKHCPFPLYLVLLFFPHKHNPLSYKLNTLKKLGVVSDDVTASYDKAKIL